MSKKEIYSKAVEAVEKGDFYRAGELAEKIGNKKLADEIYGKAALKLVEKGWFRNAEEFDYVRKLVEKISDKKLADEMYGKAALKLVEKGFFDYARKSAEKIKDKKLADDIRRRLERGAEGKGKAKGKR